MKASDLFVRCLENEGVEYIFGIPGEENLDVMDSMIGSSIKFITTRHELHQPDDVVWRYNLSCFHEYISRALPHLLFLDF